jgi:NitT/TauT family transport system substrate-binding protein
MSQRRLRNSVAAGIAAALAVLGAGCSSTAGDAGTSADSSAADTPSEVKLGYFPNITHAPAIVGIEKGYFAESLGEETKLATTAFNAGPAAIEALLSGAIDATFIGPNPAINGFSQSKGEALRIVSGAASGGVSFVVKPEINSAQDLKGKKVGTPQLGNTQDVAVRYWLKEQGLSTDIRGGGDVSIQPQENSQILQAFGQGALDGAWVPEPWATRLVKEAGGKVLLDESQLWPNGEFIITHLIVRSEFLEKYPDAVKNLIEGEQKALQLIESDPAAAQQATNDGIEKNTKKRVPDDILTTAWQKVTFTLDPLPETLRASAEHAQAVQLLEEVNLDGIYDLKALNEVLTANGQSEVSEG